MEIWNAIAAIPGAGPYLPYIFLGILVCVFIAPCFPAPSENAGGVYRFVYALVNRIALNVWHATNAGAVASGTSGGVSSTSTTTGGTVTKVLAFFLMVGLTVSLCACGDTAATVTAADSTTTSAAASVKLDKVKLLLTQLQAVETQAESAIPGVLTANGVSAADQQNVKTGLAALKTTLADLQTATDLTSTDTVTKIRAFEQALNTVVGVAAGLAVIPEPYHTVLVAAALGLPAAEAFADLAVQQGTALANTIKAKTLEKADAT